MRIRLRSWVVFQCQGHEGSKVSFESLWLFTADCQLLSVTVSVYRALCHVVNATRLIQNFSHNSWLSTAPCWILVEENMLQMKLKHNFTLRRFARVRMRLKHPVTLLTVSCFYRTLHGKNLFTNGEIFFMSNYLNVSKQYFYHNFIPKTTNL